MKLLIFTCIILWLWGKSCLPINGYCLTLAILSLEFYILSVSVTSCSFITVMDQTFFYKLLDGRENLIQSGWQKMYLFCNILSCSFHTEKLMWKTGNGISLFFLIVRICGLLDNWKLLFHLLHKPHRHINPSTSQQIQSYHHFRFSIHFHQFSFQTL